MLAKRPGGLASTSKPSAYIACGGLSGIRVPRSGRLRNAAARETTGKPCAGKPHARFEGGPVDTQYPERK